MRTILFLIGVISASFAMAQNGPVDSWSIRWNKKLILQSGKTDNTYTIRAAELKKKLNLIIEYKQGDTKKENEWKRSFMFFDESDNELKRQDGVRNWKINAADLKEIFGKNKKINLYTIAVPSDSSLAARVRVRRVYLATLEVK